MPAPQDNNPGRILITGGAGFIGSELARTYLAAGWTVGVIDNLVTGSLDNIDQDKIKFFEADITDATALAKIFAEFQPTHLSHHAAQVNVRHSLQDPAHDAEVNILGTINLLTLAAEHKLQQVLFASSGGVIYGENESQKLAEEGDPLGPMSPYGLSKLTAEYYLQWFERQYDLPVTIFRYANVYGPGQNPAGEAGVISIFLDRYQKGEGTTINGDGEQRRDFVYVGDVAQANLLATEQHSTGIFNVGSGEVTSVNELAAQLAELWEVATGERVATPQRAAAIAGEVMWSGLSNKKIANALGWQPKFTLTEGLEKTIAWTRRS